MNIINSISQIYVIVKKNIKRLLSSKISAAMVVFGPLILIMLMGLAFQGSGFNGVKVSIYSEQYNNISEKIIKTMEVSDFKIQRTKSKEECVEKVKDGEAHLCTTFPSNFEKDKMEFYVDYSRMNLVYAVVSKISAQITELSSQISMGITQDLLDFIKQSSNIMDQSSTSLTELKTNAEIMSIQLQVIKDTLDEINFDETTSTLKELTNEKSPTNLKIEIVKKQLELADQKLKQGKAELEEAEKTLETQTNSIKNTMTQMSCTSENSRDLTPYLKSQELQNQIISSPNPTCTLLNTIY
ncbi:ABC transporter permease, partial [Candidatus Woesearchaeota archaeon]|nr:ABC transporter permease [Candidatus Woesearchaeota archaeon]